MTAFDITVKNYRCFSDEAPALLTFRPGFTAFLGPNNSGKSSILRFIFEMRPIFNQLAGMLKMGPGNIVGTQTFSVNDMTRLDRSTFLSNNNSRDMTITMSAPQLPTYDEIPFGEISRRLEHAASVTITVPRNQPHCFTVDFKSNIFRSRTDIQPAEGVSIHDCVALGNSRGYVIFEQFAEAMAILANSCYIGSFRNAINIGSKSQYYDLDVGQQFITNWREAKHGANRLLHESTERITRDIESIFGFERLAINPSNDDQTLYFLIDGHSYELSELGSGLSQFLIVLATVAAKRPALLLIDEPELHLHSSLQMDFLTSIASYARYGTFFATHSPGLARATADRIFVTTKAPATTLRSLEEPTSISKVLPELLFSGTPEIGASHVLLVEGRHDIKTFQQFLRKLHIDHFVLPISLGGSAFIRGDVDYELKELLRITPRISAVIDSERSSEHSDLDSQHKDFLSICASLGIDCHILNRRAIENYFTADAISTVYGGAPFAFGPFEKPPQGWQKDRNWLVAREMDWTDIAHTDLGEFLCRLKTSISKLDT